MCWERIDNDDDGGKKRCNRQGKKTQALLISLLQAAPSLFLLTKRASITLFYEKALLLIHGTLVLIWYQLLLHLSPHRHPYGVASPLANERVKTILYTKGNPFSYYLSTLCVATIYPLSAATQGHVCLPCNLLLSEGKYTIEMQYAETSTTTTGILFL